MRKQNLPLQRLMNHDSISLSVMTSFGTRMCLACTPPLVKGYFRTKRCDPGSSITAGETVQRRLLRRIALGSQKPCSEHSGRDVAITVAG